MLNLVNKFLGPSPKAGSDMKETPAFEQRTSSGWSSRERYNGQNDRRDNRRDDKRDDKRDERRDSRSRSRDRK